MMEIAVEDLPPSLVSMVELIGFSATLKLIQRWPGVRLYIPQQIGPEHEIAQCIGHRAATRLAKHLGNEVITIARAAQAMRAARNRKIIKESRTKSARQQALEYGMTERQIWFIRSAAAEEESPQGKLL